MKYERVTARSAKGLKLRKGKKYVELLADKELTKKALCRLAEFEDKIENGTLVELPCKVGDKLYLVYSPFGDIDEWEITDIQIGKANVFRLGHKGTDDYASVLFKELGEHAFLTKDEAERRLEKVNN